MKKNTEVLLLQYIVNKQIHYFPLLRRFLSGSVGDCSGSVSLEAIADIVGCLFSLGLGVKVTLEISPTSKKMTNRAALPFSFSLGSPEMFSRNMLSSSARKQTRQMPEDSITDALVLSFIHSEKNFTCFTIANTSVDQVATTQIVGVVVGILNDHHGYLHSSF